MWRSVCRNPALWNKIELNKIGSDSMTTPGETLRVNRADLENFNLSSMMILKKALNLCGGTVTTLESQPSTYSFILMARTCTFAEENLEVLDFSHSNLIDDYEYNEDADLINFGNVEAELNPLASRLKKFVTCGNFNTDWCKCDYVDEEFKQWFENINEEDRNLFLKI
ncbi:hypothetical protein TIFTF001_003578 [Ficus carica]|uniref:Uncharacterized protein n=1 Tax=Ficus carica TaxID=3494 RepID=A0AA87Z8K1_FICCA|nr:hypothetical protein TIFTF001_003578 [Ficus carica]